MTVSLCEISCARSNGAAPRINRATANQGPATVRVATKRAFGVIVIIGSLLGRRVNNATAAVSRRRKGTWRDRVESRTSELHSGCSQNELTTCLFAFLTRTKEHKTEVQKLINIIYIRVLKNQKNCRKE